MSFLSASATGGSARSVTAVLRAEVSGYIASMRAAGIATKQALNEGVVGAAKAKTELRAVGTAAGTVGAAAALGFGLAVHAAADFEEKLATIRSLLPETSRAAVPALAEATKHFTQYGVSASEAADAEIELVKAGVSASDIIGGALAGSLTLAAAGQIDFGEATSIAVQAMTQFQLQGKDVPHVADLLAAGADKALGSVGDLGYGLSQVGTTAHQFGFSIEETVGTLAEFAQAGLIGERGGTTLKQMFLQLAAPTKQAQELMDKYGLSLYDAQGNVKSMSEVAGNLRSSFKDLTPAVRNEALAQIFGSRAIQAANILYQDGAKVNRRWTESVNDQGFAADQAAGKMDSLNGDVEKLGAAFSNMLVGLGEAGQGPLRGIVQDVTALVNAFNDLPGPIKGGILELLALTAVVGAGVFVASRLAGSYVTLRTSMATLKGGAAGAETAMVGLNRRMLLMRGGALAAGIALTQFGSSVGESHQALGGLLNVAGLAATGFAVGGPWGAAIGGGIGLLNQFAQGNADAAAATEALNAQAKALAATFDEFGNNTPATLDNIKSALQDLGTFDAADQLGLDLNLVTRAAAGGSGAIKELNSRLQGLADSVKPGSAADLANLQAGGKGLAEQYSKILPLIDEVKAGVGQQNGVVAEARHEFDQLSRAGKEGADGVSEVGDASGDAEDQMAQAAKAAKQLRSAILALDSAMLDQRATARDYQAAIDDARSALKDNGKTLDINTAKGRANQEALDGIARAALSMSTEVKKNGEVVITNRAQLESARQTLIKMAQNFGMSGQAARNYANDVLRIPAKAPTKIELEKAAAEAELAAYVAHLRDINGYTVHTYLINTVQERHLNTTSAVDGSTPRTRPPRAGGGPIIGPGGPRDDKAGLYALSNGEFVMPTAAVDKYGIDTMERMRVLAYAGGGVVGMAGGGRPGPARSANFNVEDLLRAIGRPETFLTLDRVAVALGKVRLEARQVERAEDHLHATRVRSRTQAKALQQTENTLEKARGREKVDKEQVARIEDRLQHQRYRSKQTDKALEQAEKSLSRQRDELAKATDKWKQLQQELIDQAKAIRDTVVGTGAAFGGDGTSVTARGFLAKSKAAVSQAEQFAGDVARLRKRHYYEAGIRELLAEGPTDQAAALAHSLALAPQDVLDQIGRAQRNLRQEGGRLGRFGRVAGQRIGGRGQHGKDDVYQAIFPNAKITTVDVDAAADAIDKRARRGVRVARSR